MERLTKKEKKIIGYKKAMKKIKCEHLWMVTKWTTYKQMSGTTESLSSALTCSKCLKDCHN